MRITSSRPVLAKVVARPYINPEIKTKGLGA
jgi:hypothetical protein